MNDEIVGFTFFKSYYECLCDLPIENRNEILNAMIDYVFGNIEPELKGLSKTIWVLIRPNLTTSKNRSHRNAGAPKGNQNASKQSKNNQNTIKKQSLTSLDKDKDKDKDMDKNMDNSNSNNIVNSKEKENNKNSVCNISTPTHTDIFNYSISIYSDCNENDLKKSTKKFYNFYEDKGWQNVKNWKSKLKLWIDDDINNGKVKINNDETIRNGYVFKDGKRVL